MNRIVVMVQNGGQLTEKQRLLHPKPLHLGLSKHFIGVNYIIWRLYQLNQDSL